jgi:hypothetical protein
LKLSLFSACFWDYSLKALNLPDAQIKSILNGIIFWLARQEKAVVLDS